MRYIKRCRCCLWHLCQVSFNVRCIKKFGNVGSFLNKVKMLSESKVYDRTFNEVEDAFQVNVVGYSTLGKYASFLKVTL